MKNDLKVLSLALKNAGLKKYATDVEALSSGPTALYVFDFDGTLFRSPAKPAFWNGGWWGSEESLSPPCVPETPEQDWWVDKTVAEAKSVFGDPNIISVLMTGRSEAVFSDRVNQLLTSAGLQFDEVFLSNSYDTESFKSNKITDILNSNPGINKVKIFDDRPNYLNTYSSVIKSYNEGIEVETVLVQVASKGALCNEEVPDNIDLPSRTPFVGIFLTSESKGRLFEKFPPALDNVFGDHITVIFKPTTKDLLDMKKANLFGKKFEINVVGYAENESGQAVKVEVPEASFPPGRIPHITIATAEGVKPVYSTELLTTETVTPDSGLTLSGIMWWK